MAYDGSIKIDTKIDNAGFESGFEKMKAIATKGVSAVTTSLAAISGGIIAGGTAATQVGSSFEAGMSKVSAISGATGDALQALTSKAKEMGAKTKFSASESAQALQYMSMAGWDTESMLNGIDGIMSLAAADGLDLATTSDIVTDAITAFGMKASDSSHFADVLAKASSSANTNVALLDLRLETDADYSKRQHDADVQAAEQRYNDAMAAANKQAGDTLAILQKGYSDRATALHDGTETLKRLNQSEEEENALHAAKMKNIDKEYQDTIKQYADKGIYDHDAARERLAASQKKKEEETEESNRHINSLNSIRNQQQKTLDDKNYQQQISAWSALEALYETYTGTMGEKSEDIVSAFFAPMENLDKDTKKVYEDAVQGAVNGCDEKKDSLFSKAMELANGFLGTFNRIFDRHSPSRAFRKMFRQNLEGAELGTDDEKGNLFKKSDEVAETYTKRMKHGLDKGNLVAKMRAGVDHGKSLVAQTLTAKVLHDVDVSSGDKNRKVILKGDIHSSFNIDGRETAIALTPFISEELAYEEVFV